MMTVKQLLPATPCVWSVTPETPVAEATALMRTQGVESLLVIDGATLRGLLTSHDCVTELLPQAQSPRQIPVRAVMRHDVCPVHPDEPIVSCAQQMATAEVHHLPVMDADRPLGIVSLHAVTRALVSQLSEQAFLVTQLENYITGRRS